MARTSYSTTLEQIAKCLESLQEDIGKLQIDSAVTAEKVTSIADHLKVQNGRVGKCEDKITELEKDDLASQAEQKKDKEWRLTLKPVVQAIIGGSIVIFLLHAEQLLKQINILP
jgi:septation ring formation regulator EzrA